MFELEKILKNQGNATREKNECYGGWSHTGKPCTDHLGRKFASVRERAEFYGMIPSVVHNRMKAGWNLEQALTVPPLTDRHKGRYGWSVKRPLTEAVKKHEGRKHED